MARLSLPTITLKEHGNGHYSIDLPQEALRYVTSISYERPADGFPIATISFVARLVTEEGAEFEPVRDYAPWRRSGEEEE